MEMTVMKEEVYAQRSQETGGRPPRAPRGSTTVHQEAEAVRGKCGQEYYCGFCGRNR